MFAKPVLSLVYERCCDYTAIVRADILVGESGRSDQCPSPTTNFEMPGSASERYVDRNMKRLKARFDRKRGALYKFILAAFTSFLPELF